jgi:2-dehydro-3-deoxyphosphogluconate aldolase/(4S)-4-hydroxy-2-oxoglutarate aldolase
MQETGFAAHEHASAGVLAGGSGSPDAVATAIAAAVVLPVIRTSGADEAVEIAVWAVGTDVPAVELTATTPDWRGALAELRRRSPDTVVGMGTLRTAEEAQVACDLGAAFLVSPVPAPEVAAVAAERGVLMIGGGFTPAELIAAARNGMAKLFPAHAVGPRYLRSVLTVAPPGTRVIPTGGISLDDVEAWLDAGAVAVGIGSELKPTPEAAERLRALRAAA